ncbi:hypothetical protein CC2G_014326 [Coprinopsis cinerea AmutBmut pab1-1]|nr:hypothetical protein CC2G_014326 [Coprinopsis cinerea AmutBmut pab1-1]
MSSNNQAKRHRRRTLHKRRTTLRTARQTRGEEGSTGKEYSRGLNTGVPELDLEKESITHLGTHGDSISSMVWSKETNDWITGSWTAHSDSGIHGPPPPPKPPHLPTSLSPNNAPFETSQI